MAEEEKRGPSLISRRRFIGGAGVAVVGGAVSGAVGSQFIAPPTASAGAAPGAQVEVPVERIVERVVEKQVAMTFPASTGYLIVDPKKCAGCLNCMLACSLAHEGEATLSLARIQITQDSFQRYPNDLQQSQCRQCSTPVCVQNCPTGACHVDTSNGNVRVIDESMCIGCQTCLSSCPQVPRRVIWNPQTKKATKCDLCLDTPGWDEKGGATGKQACVEVCPMKAIKLVNDTPIQMEIGGYETNLRMPSVADVFMDVD